MKPNVQALRDIKDIELNRREVFKLGSAAVVTPALLGASLDWDATWTFSAAAAASASTTSIGPVSVGYWSGQPDTPFVDARQANGPAIEGSSLQLQVVSGGCPHAFSSWQTLQSIGLRVDLRPNHEAELRAWHLQRTPVASQSSPTPLTVAASGGLTCWLDIRDSQPGSEPAHVRLHFTPDANRGTLALQAGYYAVVLAAPGSRRWTNWDSLHLDGDDCGNSLRLVQSTGELLDRPHLVFTLDG